MAASSGSERYAPLSIALHWFMLLLLAAVYACMEFRGYFPRGSGIREGLKTWHYMLGLSVLMLVVVRLLVRLATPVPRVEPALSRMQSIAARLVHAVLYLFMLGMPVVGWMILSAEGDAIPFFGLQFPPLVGESESLAELLEEIHETAANIGYFLVGLHAAAALFHHYVLRDNTLWRMLPRRRPGALP